jgi:hypothetical protein
MGELFEGSSKEDQIASAKRRIASLETMIQKNESKAGEADPLNRKGKIKDLLAEEQAKLRELEG